MQSMARKNIAFFALCPAFLLSQMFGLLLTIGAMVCMFADPTDGKTSAPWIYIVSMCFSVLNAFWVILNDELHKTTPVFFNLLLQSIIGYLYTVPLCTRPSPASTSSCPRPWKWAPLEPSGASKPSSCSSCMGRRTASWATLATSSACSTSHRSSSRHRIFSSLSLARSSALFSRSMRSQAG